MTKRLSEQRETALRVGLCGLGTVGAGLVELLTINAAEIERRAGRPIRLTRVASRTPKPEIDLGDVPFSTDLQAVLGANDVDVVVELIGGEERALEISRAALSNDKSLVTANKALLALHGEELFGLARDRQLALGLEAAVAGGIPIINALLDGLGGNQIDWVAGIINGTCNYILSAMAEEGADFSAALATAQELGYAEADPSFDVGGIDAAHKLAIIASLVFGRAVEFADVPVAGIEHITAEDIEYAKELGYVIKHLGVTRRHTAAGSADIEVRVHPALVPAQAPLAAVGGVTNSVVVHDNAVGTSVYTGPGAGALPTAASVVADLIRVARGTALPPTFAAERARIVPLADSAAAFYVRIPVLDEPGVLAQLASFLSAEGISIESVIQREQAVRADAAQSWVPIVLLTQKVTQRALDAALATIASHSEVVGEIVALRVETLAAGTS